MSTGLAALAAIFLLIVVYSQGKMLVEAHRDRAGVGAVLFFAASTIISGWMALLALGLTFAGVLEPLLF